MKKFSVGLFLRNLKYLGRYNIQKMNERIPENVVYESQLNQAIDNLIYELPYLEQHAQQIQRPVIKTFEETLDELVNTNKSIIRFGDGEVVLMNNQSIGFQRANAVLARRLREIIATDCDDIMICINYHYYHADLLNLLDYPKFVYRTFIKQVRERLNQYLIPGRQYYSAGITSCYQMFSDFDFAGFYEKLKTVWRDKKITIICGDETFKGFEYNIFDCAKSINYIYAPFANAMDKYDEILKAALAVDKDNLMIVILGPTAKPLCYDLVLQGYRALDLGHLPKDYDAFMKNNNRDKNTIGKFFEN